MSELNEKQIDIFEYTDDYRDPLNDILKLKGRIRKGSRGALAKAIRCQGAYISQVLAYKAHLNLEQAERLNEYFGHNRQEAHYFLLLVQKTRASTASLKKYFHEQLEDLQRQRLNLRQRFQAENKLSESDQSIYYSSWIYGAIRVLLTIPEFQTPEKIAAKLKITLNQTKEVLNFLCLRNLAKLEEGKYITTETTMYLGDDSIMLKKHHTNWRMRAIHSLDYIRPDDLHYSSVISLSHADAVEIKKIIVGFLEEVRAVIKKSPEEELFSFDIDFFRL